MDRGEKLGWTIVVAIWFVNGIITGVRAWLTGKMRAWWKYLVRFMVAIFSR